MDNKNLVFHRLFLLFIKSLSIFYFFIFPIVFTYVIYNYIIWLENISDILANCLTFLNVIMIIMNIVLTLDSCYYPMDSISESLLKIKVSLDGFLMLCNILFFIFFYSYKDIIKLYSLSIYIISLFFFIWTIVQYNTQFLYTLYNQEEYITV